MRILSRSALAGFAVALVSFAVPAQAAVYTNTIARVSAYITNQMVAHNVQGMSIVLVEDQEVVWAQGFGYADRESGVEADADTVYHIGSCSKAFLGTAVMQLLDQGLIDLEASPTNYIPEFSMLPRFTNSEPVTVRAMLNHHSGLPGDFFNGMMTTREDEDSTEWLIAYLRNDHPFAPVNERYYYCNTGFTLMSEVVARIAGKTFADATEELLFDPLGMDASSFLFNKQAISNRMAAAYDSEGQLMVPEFLNCLGSGSMFSSVDDLAKYIRMILADGAYGGQTVVSSNSIDIMTTPQLTNLPLNVSDTPQGLGWDDAYDHRFRYSGKVFWKDGGTLFHCAFLGISRDLKLGVAVIQNSPGSLCDEVGAEALRWAILDKEDLHWPTNTFVPELSPVTNLPQAELDALAGAYVGSEGYHMVIAGAGALTLVANAHSESPSVLSNLVPRANGWFSVAESQNIQLAFTNLGGHDMLVLHKVDGAFESVDALGEHYLPDPLESEWSARTNIVYRMIDMHPWDYLWESGFPMPKTLRFAEADGLLLACWGFGGFVIEPESDTLAFQRGTHYRKGGAVQVSLTNGVELVQYSSYRFIDESAIPTLSVPSSRQDSTPFAGGTQWYWFEGSSGMTYRVLVSSSTAEVFTRITDREGASLAAGTNAPLAWTCTEDGTYSIAVNSVNECAFNISITRSPSPSTVDGDYDGDGKRDLAVYHEESGYWHIIPSGTLALSYAKLGEPGYVPAR